MSDNNGDTPRFPGAVPLGPPPQVGTQMVSCIWHSAGIEHPPGAPECQFHGGTDQMVMPVTQLLGWLTITVTTVARAYNGMAEHLAELGVQVEALDATLPE
jgi:hypothetical protein